MSVKKSNIFLNQLLNDTTCNKNNSITYIFLNNFSKLNLLISKLVTALKIKRITI